MLLVVSVTVWVVAAAVFLTVDVWPTLVPEAGEVLAAAVSLPVALVSVQIGTAVANLVRVGHLDRAESISLEC